VRRTQWFNPRPEVEDRAWVFAAEQLDEDSDNHEQPDQRARRPLEYAGQLGIAKSRAIASCAAASVTSCETELIRSSACVSPLRAGRTSSSAWRPG
jgi:hypothetical protein